MEAWTAEKLAENAGIRRFQTGTTNLHDVEASNTHNPAAGHNSTPPPQRHFSVQVSHHQLVVRIQRWVVHLALHTLLRSLLVGPELPRLRFGQLLQVTRCCPRPAGLDIVEVPQHHVCEGGSQTRVGCNEIRDVCPGEERRPLRRQLGLIDFEIGIQDIELVVCDVVCAVGRSIQQLLGEEREVEGPPDIAVVDAWNSAKVRDYTLKAGWIENLPMNKM